MATESGSYTDDILWRRRLIAQQLAEQNKQPIQHWTQGLSHLANNFAAGAEDAGLRNEQRSMEAKGNAALAQALGLPAPEAAPQSPRGIDRIVSLLSGTGWTPPTQGASQPPARASTGGGIGREAALDAIMNFESGGRNIPQQVVGPNGGFNPSTGTVTGPSSAQGYFQMIDPTWRRAAELAGVDTKQYPTAMSAPYEIQRKVAGALYDKNGFADWAPYNAKLRQWIKANGGEQQASADLPAPGASEAIATGFQPGNPGVPAGSFSGPAVRGNDPTGPVIDWLGRGPGPSTYAPQQSPPPPQARASGPAWTGEGDTVQPGSGYTPTFAREGMIGRPDGTGFTQSDVYPNAAGGLPAFARGGVPDEAMAPLPAAGLVGGPAPQVASSRLPLPPPRPFGLNPSADMPAPGATSTGPAAPPPFPLDGQPEGNMNVAQALSDARGGMPSLFRGGAPTPPPQAPQPPPVQSGSAPTASPAAAPVGGAGVSSPSAPPTSPAGQRDPRQVAMALYANPATRQMGQNMIAQLLSRDPTKEALTQEQLIAARNTNAEFPTKREAGQLDVEGKRLGNEKSRRELPTAGQTAQQQNYNFYANQERDAGRQPKSFFEWSQEQGKASASNVTVNNAVNPILKGMGEQFVAGAESARASVDTIRTIHNARKEIDSEGGIFSGAAGTGQLNLAKVGSLFGVTDPKAIANTEAFRAAIGESVLNRAKALGANPSNTDRDYIQAVMAGNISLDEKSIRRILDIQEKSARTAIERHNSLADKMLETQPELKQVAPMLRIEPPPEYQKPAGSNAPVKVTSPDEARKLPKGTRIILPDGSAGVVP